MGRLETINRHKPLNRWFYRKDKPPQMIEPKPDNPVKLNKLPSLPYLILSAFLIPLALIILSLSWYSLNFNRYSDRSFFTLVPELAKGFKMPFFNSTETVSYLILGLDELGEYRSDSMLTDTIMVVSFNRSGQAVILSLPRDLWIDDLKTKINSLYYYGEISPETTGEILVSGVVAEITGLTIDKTITLKLESVRDLIDAQGGIDIEVTQGFTDPKFPREDVDPATPDEDLLYETITFTTGVQHFDGTTALKYIRSRNSPDLTQGTDIARMLRQQQVFTRLITTLTDPKLYLNPKTAGRLYRVYDQHFINDFSVAEIVSISRYYLKEKPQLVSAHLPVTGDEQTGLIINPPVDKYGQWVFEPVDPTWQATQQWIKLQLFP